jgi:GDP-4-dehydro-6-deoxy-D-mannose reductase
MNHTAPTLVTGALGFVGCWLIEDLLQAGTSVVGFSRLPAGMESPVRYGPFTLEGPDPDLPSAMRYRSDSGIWSHVCGSLEDRTQIADLIQATEPAVIFHLAAQSSAAVSFQDPFDTFNTNLMGTLSLLEAVRQRPPAKIPVMLAVGSAEEYGATPQKTPMPENTPLRPISPYGVSKAAQGLLCQQYHQSYDLPIIVVRSFSHTGPGQDTRFVFPSFATQIVAGERGEADATLAVGNLTAVRDYLDVRDVVGAYRLLITSGDPGQVYNICSGQPLTIQEGLDILLEAAHIEFAIVPDPERQRPSDIPYLVGDNTKLRADTGWSPQFDFRQTLNDVLAWARKETE